jgi:hypothetical protein
MQPHKHNKVCHDHNKCGKNYILDVFGAYECITEVAKTSIPGKKEKQKSKGY